MDAEILVLQIPSWVIYSRFFQDDSTPVVHYAAVLSTCGVSPNSILSTWFHRTLNEFAMRLYFYYLTGAVTFAIIDTLQYLNNEIVVYAYLRSNTGAGV